MERINTTLFPFGKIIDNKILVMDKVHSSAQKSTYSRPIFDFKQTQYLSPNLEDLRVPQDFLELVKKHNRLNQRIRQRDVVFRHRYHDASNKMPFQAARHPDKLATTYHRLDAGEIDQDDALDEITSVMERYYGTPYPLDV